MVKPIPSIVDEELEAKVKSDRLKPITLTQLLSNNYPPSSWLIDQLIPETGITIIAGAPGAGKTWLAIELAIKVSTGGLFLNQFTTEKRKVWIIDEEMTERRLQERFKAFGVNPTEDIFVTSFSQFRLNDQSISQVIEIAKDNSIKVIIFDSYVRISNVQDENSATDTSKAFGFLQKLIGAGLTVVLTHHKRKGGTEGVENQGDNLRGSSDILAAIDSLLLLHNPGGELFKMNITHQKSRHSKKVSSFTVELLNDEDGKKEFIFLGDLKTDKQKETEQLKIAIKETIELNPTANQLDIVTIVRNEHKGYGQPIIRRTLREMVEKNEITEARGNKGAISYQLVEPAD